MLWRALIAEARLLVHVISISVGDGLFWRNCRSDSDNLHLDVTVPHDRCSHGTIPRTGAITGSRVTLPGGIMDSLLLQRWRGFVFKRCHCSNSRLQCSTQGSNRAGFALSRVRAASRRWSLLATDTGPTFSTSTRMKFS